MVCVIVRSDSAVFSPRVGVTRPGFHLGHPARADTTGIEPDLALIKYKKLVGGGVIKIVNNTVPAALIKLGYSPAQVEKIVTHIDSTGTIEDAPELKPEHLKVFDCSFRPQNGVRSIHYMGHVKMMAAVQPFISGNLQYGVPFKFLVDKFAHVRFEPSGWTGNQQIPYAKSIMDYIFRWMGAKFLGPEYAVSEAGDAMTLRPTETSPQQELPFNAMTTDAPLCSECGSIMTRNGSCYKCGNCGGTSGCS